MSLRCLLELTTSDGTCYAMVCVHTLHQLAVLMPAPVVSYELQIIEELPCSGPVDDDELYMELMHIIEDMHNS